MSSYLQSSSCVPFCRLSERRAGPVSYGMDKFISEKPLGDGGRRTLLSRPVPFGLQSRGGTATVYGFLPGGIRQWGIPHCRSITVYLDLTILYSKNRLKSTSFLLIRQFSTNEIYTIYNGGCTRGLPADPNGYAVRLSGNIVKNSKHRVTERILRTCVTYPPSFEVRFLLACC